MNDWAAKLWGLDEPGLSRAHKAMLEAYGAESMYSRYMRGAKTGTPEGQVMAAEMDRIAAGKK